MTMFPREEFMTRLDKVKKSMKEKDIDVLLVSDPANMCYLTGHNAWSFYVHQMVLVDVNEEMPYFIGRYMDAFSGVVKTTYLDEAHVRAYSDDHVQSLTKHPMDYVAKVVKELGLDKKNIGVEMDNYYFTAKAYAQLQKGLPDANFKNGDLIVNWVRIVKSPAEIKLMKRAGKIVEKAMQATIDTMAAGVRENDVVAAIYNAQIKGTEEFGGDYTAIVPMLPEGETAGAPHLTWSDKKYPENTVVAVEIAGAHQRYHSPLARTIAIGEPSEEVKRIAEITIEGLNAALEQFKPGNTAEMVEAAWNKVLKKHGFHKESRIGYSMGLNFPPDWGEHTASLRPGDKTVFEPGMTFHCIPGMYLDNFGVSISESVVITEDGYETLANFPRKLFTV
ncbi:Xaa-Pro dipeptidase [Alkalibacterium putridalgicola]|uniref:Ectoine hydrolase DoeA n=1 Tax=Alkalibacterium putridalgicola TaxID=426703 RepID=A0A1H7SP77_9LACT|nr:Xaa-Pro peptidase family protein [Alkalibacterium putridalgicola]GEK89194.1 ectoine hydrolase DoeA [Alkalibacterium putridalgicola]SEL74313.1 Xaa-Pro dipeptidase [Alkalibacterium putridalgicola]